MGSFYIRNCTHDHTDAFIAYHVYSSSSIPFKIAPASGFVRPGSLDQIGVQFPENGLDKYGNMVKHDINYLP